MNSFEALCDQTWIKNKNSFSSTGTSPERMITIQWFDFTVSIDGKIC